MEALGLVTSIIQFVDFSCKLIVLARRVHDAPGGILEEHDALRQGANGLHSCVVYLKAQQHSQGGHCEDVIDGLCVRATSIAKEVSIILDRLRIAGVPGKWTSVKVTIRALGLEKKCAALDKRIAALRKDLELQYRVFENRLIRDQLDEIRADIKDLKLVHRQTLNLCSLNERKPRDLGYPWEASKGITVDDGIGPSYEFPIDLCATLGEFVHVLHIKFKSRGLPGLYQVQMGHVSISDGSGNMTLTEANWKTNVKAGSSVRTSFIMSRWHGLNYQKCARCRKPYNKTTDAARFKTCKSCDLSLCLVEPDDISFEPRDLVIGIDPDCYRDYKLHERKDVEQADVSSKSHIDHQPDEPTDSSQTADNPPVDMVCRYLIVKWEPIFNIVHRYLFCRCVIRLSTPSRSRFDEEVNTLVPNICPRHNIHGLKRKDYGDLVSNLEDPYFDQYGGYGVFKAMMSCMWSCERLGNLFTSKDERATAFETLAKMGPEVVDKIYDNLKFEIYSHMQEYGVELPRHIAVRVQERKDLEAFKTPFGDGVRINGLKAEDIPPFREVREILDGKWDGKPHWSLKNALAMEVCK